MNGEEFIDQICKLLTAEDVRVYDSNIISKLRNMSQDELMRLLKPVGGEI